MLAALHRAVAAGAKPQRRAAAPQQRRPIPNPLLRPAHARIRTRWRPLHACRALELIVAGTAAATTINHLKSTVRTDPRHTIHNISKQFLLSRDRDRPHATPGDHALQDYPDPSFIDTHQEVIKGLPPLLHSATASSRTHDDSLPVLAKALPAREARKRSASGPAYTSVHNMPTHAGTTCSLYAHSLLTLCLHHAQSCATHARSLLNPCSMCAQRAH